MMKAGKSMMTQKLQLLKLLLIESDLQYMYDNPQSDSMHLVQVSFKNAYINEMIDSVGFRIRGNTSRDSFKKSFKLSFNTFVDRWRFLFFRQNKS